MRCLRVTAHVAILAIETRREVFIIYTHKARVLALASTGSPKALIIEYTDFEVLILFKPPNNPPCLSPSH